MLFKKESKNEENEKDTEQSFDFSFYGTTFIDRLKNAVLAAKETDPNYQVFGSSKHQYRFGHPVTMDDIADFEKKYNINLPKGYVEYMTLAGNGGAGPQYGLYRLEDLDKHNEFLLNNDFTETFIDKDLTVEKWNSIAEAIEKTNDDDTYQSLMKKIIKGALVIGTHGCTVDALLMCSGSEYGKIVYIDWDLEHHPILTGLTFEEWILEYFHKIAVNDVYKDPHSNMKVVIM